jgi:hypothetical protein
MGESSVKIVCDADAGTAERRRWDARLRQLAWTGVTGVQALPPESFVR